MPRYTVIVPDRLFGIDGVFREIVISKVDPRIHALHWDGTKGEGELVDPRENKPITSFPEFAALVAAWTDAGKPKPAPAPTTIAEARRRKLAALEAHRHAITDRGFLWTDGHRYDRHRYDRHREDMVMIRSIVAAIAAGLGVPGGGTTFSYWDFDGVPRRFTAQQFLAFAKAITDDAQARFDAWEVHRKAINAIAVDTAKTAARRIQDIESYDFTGGWPA